MKEIGKILVCVDLSKYSEETVEYSKTFAKKFGAQIVLLNVINQRDIDTLKAANYYYPDKINLDSYLERVRTDRQKKMEDVDSLQPAEGMEGARILVRVGVPFEEILKTIEEEQVDLVVMGKKGKSNFPTTLFGSTAEKLFKYAKIPIVSVRS
ncbi:MAG: universal stress protein [Desulforhopalus sp.]